MRAIFELARLCRWLYYKYILKWIAFSFQYLRVPPLALHIRMRLFCFRPAHRYKCAVYSSHFSTFISLISCSHDIIILCIDPNTESASLYRKAIILLLFGCDLLKRYIIKSIYNCKQNDKRNKIIYIHCAT